MAIVNIIVFFWYFIIIVNTTLLYYFFSHSFFCSHCFSKQVEFFFSIKRSFFNKNEKKIEKLLLEEEKNNTCFAERQANSLCSNWALSDCIVLWSSAKWISDSVTQPFSELTGYAAGFVTFSSSSSMSAQRERERFEFLISNSLHWKGNSFYFLAYINFMVLYYYLFI